MDEEIRLQLKTLGTEGVTNLKKRLAELKAEGGETAAAFGRGEISLEEYDREMKRAADSAKALEQQLKRLESAAAGATPEVRELTRASEGAGKGAKQAQQGFLDLSRAASDWATGGFLGVVNNLEGIGRAIPALLKNPMAILSGLPAILSGGGRQGRSGRIVTFSLYRGSPRRYNRPACRPADGRPTVHPHNEGARR